MRKKDSTEAIIDGVLRFIIVGGSIAGGILIPNLLIALEKPLDLFAKKMDKRSKERELRRIVSYMKTQKLIAGNYEHGLVITKDGRQRLEKSNLKNLKINGVKKWDKKWRVILYDIPEDKKAARDNLSRHLNSLGCYQLQRSVWLHPFSCRKQITQIALAYGVENFVTYLNALDIAGQEKIISKFKRQYPHTIFE